VVDRADQTLCLEGLPAQAPPPALSLLRHFSAPVKLEMGRPTGELVHLLATDSDPFARWDAGQVLLRRAVLRRAAGRPDAQLEEELLDAFRRILADPSLAESSRSVLLALPGLAELEDAAPQPDGLAAPFRHRPGRTPGRSPGALHAPVGAALAGRGGRSHADRHDLELAGGRR
jgi:aminopeptidase N